MAESHLLDLSRTWFATKRSDKVELTNVKKFKVAEDSGWHNDRHVCLVLHV